jgi:integrase
MANLTDTYVRKATCPEGKAAHFLSDPASPGLRLRVTPAGRKSWLYRYRLKAGGTRREIKLGEYPGVSLQDARLRWREVRDQRDRGLDPQVERGAALEARRAAERAEAEAAVRNGLTFARLADAFLTAVSTVGNADFKKSWREDQRILNRYFQPTLGHRPALEIAKADIAAVLEPLRKAGKNVQANRCLACVRRLYRWGTEADVLPAPHDPTLGLKNRREQAKERHLSAEELRAFLGWLEAGNPAHDALRMILLTGQRPGEVCGMHGRDVKGDVWTIPETKNGRRQTVFLAPEAAATVEGRAGWVFPARTGSGHVRVDRLSKVTRDASAELGLEGFTPHDLRRTMATWLGEELVADRVIRRILNHMEGGVTQVYQRAKLDRGAREAWARWARSLEESMSVSDTEA